MTRDSIEAYDLPERVARYDADMAVMHPNRSKMVQIALEVLPFEPDARLEALDLGAGTGYFSARLLEAFPASSVHALDGAQVMLDVASERLGDKRSAATFHVGDLRDLRDIFAEERFDVVFSSYTLHHLTLDEKKAVMRHAASLLRPGGWLLNADIIVAETPAVEERIQDLRIRGILERAAGRDRRFADRETARRYLDEMEAAEGDRPLTLRDDLEAMRDAGLEDVAVFWLEYREAVSGGRRAG
ncbi:MAG: class I SAM-dependent methyltransferase [Chloroflexi bacterium]|nr:class I SAM-dependent methyltransferase [Chloroflexota bacterium]